MQNIIQKHGGNKATKLKYIKRTKGTIRNKKNKRDYEKKRVS